MAIPDFQTLMLPLLKLAADGQEHTLREATDRIADDMGLPESDRRELLPSGRQARLVNRVGWAKTYLKKTLLVEDVGRARFRIAARGREVLAENPTRIDLRYLERFPELDEFRNKSREDDGDTTEGSSPQVAGGAVSTQTPEEALEAAYQQVRKKLAEELLERVSRCSPAFFEELVVDLLVAMGYGGSRRDAGEAVGRSGDEGIDGIIKEDRLGLDAIYIQAKRWEGTVGRPQIQAFVGSLEGHRARKGVFITTSRFSGDAQEYVQRIERKIVLIDGAQLAQLMMDFGVGVSAVATYAVKRIDLDYFAEEG